MDPQVSDSDIPKDEATPMPKLSAGLPELSAKAISKFKARQEKRGVVYLSVLPHFMTRRRIRQWLSKIGPVGNVLLSEGDDIGSRIRVAKRKVARKKGSRSRKRYMEGWVEFLDKKHAKEAALRLNNSQVGGRRSDPWYDDIWNIRYLPRFKWEHLTEQVQLERKSMQERILTEELQAKRELEEYNSRALETLDNSPYGGGGGPGRNANDSDNDNGNNDADEANASGNGGDAESDEEGNRKAKRKAEQLTRAKAAKDDRLVKPTPNAVRLFNQRGQMRTRNSIVNSTPDVGSDTVLKRIFS